MQTYFRYDIVSVSLICLLDTLVAFLLKGCGVDHMLGLLFFLVFYLVFLGTDVLGEMVE